MAQPQSFEQPAQPAEPPPKSKTSPLITLNMISRVLIWVSAVIIVVTGVMAMIFSLNSGFISFFIGIYQCVFGVLLGIGETGWRRFVKTFPFLLTRFFRGCFTVFCGTLFLCVKINGYTWPCVVICIVLAVFGIFHCVISCLVKTEREQKTVEMFKQEHVISNEPDVATQKV
ncbi:hypothetical protein BLNAU_807 [Blattamonas nauphoetae]|uniref:COPI associated protein n=1 Tax=Blattamonas nauphoetae TaxID=2049346 RepID=A0ABQ9YKJ2_9EUKA|nr:hypothetical protein BLNAU_807 [Blattamonas nauphoetae]